MVSRNVRRVRELRELKQADLARLLGWSRTSISRLEAGERGCSVDDLLALAAALTVAPAWLLVPWEDDDPKVEIVLRGGNERIIPENVEAQEWAVGDQPLWGIDDPRDYYWAFPTSQRRRRNGILEELEADGVVSFPDANTVTFHGSFGQWSRTTSEDD